MQISNNSQLINNSQFADSNPITDDKQTTTLPKWEGVGLSASQVKDLKDVARMAYGSGRKEGAKGGEGYIGVFTDSLGRPHLVKMLTHHGEYKNVKGNEAQYLEGLDAKMGSGFAEAVRDATKRLCERLLDIAAAVGKRDEVYQMLAGSGGAGENNFPPLLSRKLAAKIVKTITGNDGQDPNVETTLRMRIDEENTSDASFKWADIGKSRAKTIDKTRIGTVLHQTEFHEVRMKEERDIEEGKFVAMTGRQPESEEATSAAYFEFTQEVKNSNFKSFADIDNIVDNNERKRWDSLIANARESQKTRMTAKIDSLNFDPAMHKAYANIMRRFVNLHQAAGNNNNGLPLINFIESPDIENMVEFCNAHTKVAFLDMLKDEMKKNLEPGHAPITPREMENFMFKAINKAFMCAAVLDPLFNRIECLEEAIKKDDSHEEKPEIHDAFGTKSLNDKIVEYGSDSSFQSTVDVQFLNAKNKNLFFSPPLSKDNEYQVKIAASNAKRYQAMYAMVKMHYNNYIHGSEIEDDIQNTDHPSVGNLASAFRTGECCNYSLITSKEAELECKRFDVSENKYNVLGAFYCQDGDEDVPHHESKFEILAFKKMVTSIVSKTIGDTFLGNQFSKSIFTHGEKPGEGRNQSHVNKFLLQVKNEYLYQQGDFPEFPWLNKYDV